MGIPDTGLQNIPQNDYFSFKVKAANESKLSEIQKIWIEKNDSERVPFYFEQVAYKIRVIANNSKNKLIFRHYRQDIIDSLTETEEPNRLDGVLNFKNDVGFFEFSIEVRNEIDKRIEEFHYRWNVYPRKLNSQKDYHSMIEKIQEVYPSWIWCATSVTQHESSTVSRRNNLNLIWLQLFFSVGEEFIKQINAALNAPHNKLAPKVKYLRADRIGKIKGKIEESIAEGIEKDPSKKIRIEKQISTQDTFENRWLKHSVTNVGSKLAEILKIITDNDKELYFSNDIKLKMKKQILQLNKAERHSVLKSVGLFRSMDRESLVLHHRYGYAGAYRYWLILKKQIELLENSKFRIGLKQISELYEVWCLLEMKNILCGNDSGYRGLGFTEKKSRKPALRIKDLEYQLKKGKGVSFEFSNAEGVILKLAHEPRYGKRGIDHNPKNGRIVSFTGLQKPDIWLEAIFKNGLKVVYVFDAKYRIQFKADSFNTQQADDDPIDYNNNDLVPVEALNQLHRYRDAIIHLESRNKRITYGDRNRLVAGGFALYPGVYNQNILDENNPYQQSIDEIGIGAFPCVPSADGKNNKWLESFLKSKLTTPSEPFEVAERGIELIDHRSVRIPQRGITQRIGKKGLTMIIPLGSDRTQEYIDKFISGKATFYHTRAAEYRRSGVSRNRAREIDFIAFSIKGSIKHVYKVHGVEETLRENISQENAGNSKPFKVDSDRMYLTFQIEFYKSLEIVLKKKWGRGSFHCYSYLEDLQKSKSYDDASEKFKYSVNRL